MTPTSGPAGAPDARGRLREGLARLGLSFSPGALAALLLHAELVARWSQRVALTAHRDLDALIVKGTLDALAWLPALPAEPGGRLVDIGSGAGFPGIPLALARPDLRVTLLEASRRKASLLAELVRELGLVTATAAHGRAEAMARDAHAGARYEVATSRAIAPADLLPGCLGLLAARGRLVLSIGPRGSAAAGALPLPPPWAARRLVVRPPFQPPRRLLIIERA
jgi:16S rRNA (guanine527-N7)-methyltransferase